MPHDDPSFSNQDIRDRIAVVKDQVTQLQGRQMGHEDICTLRYSEILKAQGALEAKMQAEFALQNTKLDFISKVGGIVAFIIIGIELGKAVAPGLIEALFKVIH